MCECHVSNKNATDNGQSMQNRNRRQWKFMKMSEMCTCLKYETLSLAKFTLSVQTAVGYHRKKAEIACLYYVNEDISM